MICIERADTMPLTEIHHTQLLPVPIDIAAEIIRRIGERCYAANGAFYWGGYTHALREQVPFVLFTRADGSAFIQYEMVNPAKAEAIDHMLLGVLQEMREASPIVAVMSRRIH